MLKLIRIFHIKSEFFREISCDGYRESYIETIKCDRIHNNFYISGSLKVSLAYRHQRRKDKQVTIKINPESLIAYNFVGFTRPISSYNNYSSTNIINLTVFPREPKYMTQRPLKPNDYRFSTDLEDIHAICVDKGEPVNDINSIPISAGIYKAFSTDPCLDIENNITLKKIKIPLTLYLKDKNTLDLSVHLKQNYIIMRQSYNILTVDSEHAFDKNKVTIINANTMEIIHEHNYNKKNKTDLKAAKIVDKNSKYYTHLEDKKILNLETFEKLEYEGDLIYFDDEYLISMEDELLKLFKIETGTEK